MKYEANQKINLYNIIVLFNYFMTILCLIYGNLRVVYTI